MNMQRNKDLELSIWVGWSKDPLDCFVFLPFFMLTTAEFCDILIMKKNYVYVKGLNVLEDLKKSELFERTPVPKAVFTLAVPMIISSLVMVIYNLADTYFVGMLDDPIQNAGVTLAAPVLLAFNAVNNLFGVGSSSMMSRALGRKDYETVRRSSAFGIYCAVFCGFLFSLFYTVFQNQLLTVLGAKPDTVKATADYLLWTTTFGAIPAILNVVMAQMVRAEGAALHASIGTMSGCILNIILDPIFILPWGLNMGASGAGLATLISNCFACVYFFMLTIIKRKNTYVCVSPKYFSFKKDVVFGIFAVGIPASIQNLLNVTGMTILNNFTAEFNENAVAAMGIAHKINMIPMYIAMGVSQGIMPLIGYNYAQRNTLRMKQTLKFSAMVSLSFLTLMSAVFYFASGGLIGLFMENTEVVSYGAAFLKGQCFSLPFLCLDFLAVGVFQACGMGKKALIFAIMRKVILEIPALYILNWLWPLYGLAYAAFVAELILSVIAVATLLITFKKIENKSI